MSQQKKRKKTDKFRYGYFEDQWGTREEIKAAVGPGWGKLIDRILDVLTPDTLIMQVKEKFGGLRFYIGGATNEIFDVIDQAEEDSYTTCEECGKPGKLREELSWILTLCDKHYRAHLLWLSRRHAYKGQDLLARISKGWMEFLKGGK